MSNSVETSSVFSQQKYFFNKCYTETRVSSFQRKSLYWLDFSPSLQFSTNWQVKLVFQLLLSKIKSCLQAYSYHLKKALTFYTWRSANYVVSPVSFRVWVANIFILWSTYTHTQRTPYNTTTVATSQYHHNTYMNMKFIFL